MLNWYHDLNFGRSIKNNLGTLNIDLFESSPLSHTFDTMFENENIPNEHKNKLLQTMHEYLQLPLNSSSSYFIILLNANNFIFKPGMISILPNSMA